MTHPELSREHIRSLRALASGVAEARSANPASPDANSTSISPMAMATLALARAQPGPDAVAPSTVYRYRAALLQLAQVLKRPDAVARIEEWLREAPTWQNTPEIREQFLASLRGDLPAMAHLLDSTAVRIRTSPAARRPAGSTDPGSADDTFMQLEEPPLGTPAPRDVRDRYGRRVHVPLMASEVRELRDWLRRGLHPLHVAFPPPGLSRPAQLQAEMGAFSGMLLEATWSTGLRPIEWCSAAVRVEAEDGRVIDMSLAVASLMESSELPDPARRPDKWLEAMAELLAKPLGFGTPWLVVQNAKSGEAARKGLPLERLLEITRLPDSTQTVIWCVAEIFRSTWPLPDGMPFHLWRSEERDEAEARLRTARKRITRVGEKLLPEYPGAINLRVLRRDFGDRAKAVLTREEVAVVLGHASLKSQAACGRNASHVKRVNDRDYEARVTPHPDFVDAFRLALKKPGKEAKAQL